MTLKQRPSPTQNGQIAFFLLLLIGVWLLLFQAMMVFAHVLIAYKHVQFAANAIANAGVGAYGKAAIPLIEVCLEEKKLELAESESCDLTDPQDCVKAALQACLEEEDLDSAEQEAKQVAQQLASKYQVQLDQKEWKKDSSSFRVAVSDDVDYSAGKYFSRQKFQVNAESKLVLNIP